MSEIGESSKILKYGINKLPAYKVKVFRERIIIIWSINRIKLILDDGMRVADLFMSSEFIFIQFSGGGSPFRIYPPRISQEKGKITKMV